MTADALLELLDRNRRHTDALDDDHFADVRDAQRPEVVSMCCADSRVSQEGMWSVDEPGWLFAPSNVGNQAWDEVDGERVVNGNLLYPVAHTGTRTVAVVGHTGCGAVTAAYESVVGDADPEPPGIAKWVRLLEPVVEDGLASDAVDADAPDDAVVNRLVEYNVRRQTAFLRDADEIPADAAVHGFVYDFHDAYGDVPGRAYLVDCDGATDPDAIAAQLPDEYAGWAASLLG